MRQRHPDEWVPTESVITEEISQPALAVEYLAANFEVASYRAQFDWAPVSWMTFTAWHNQGVVSPASIAANGQLARVLPTVETYFPAAMKLVYAPPLPLPAFVRTPLAR